MKKLIYATNFNFQDKRSILATFRSLGDRHPELTLPLVNHLLELHPFFEGSEPDIDDTSYVCILILIFNAARHCPTLEPMLDQHTKRHYHFLLDTYPHLMPQTEAAELQIVKGASNTKAFLRQILNRIRDSEHLSMGNRIKLLEQSDMDLERLGSIEVELSHSTQLVKLYLSCQIIFLRSLTSRFWVNTNVISSQEIHVLESNLERLRSNCLQLTYRFEGLSQRQKFQLKLLKTYIAVLQVIFIVRASNKSALSVSEQLLQQLDHLNRESTTEEIRSSTFLSALISALSASEDRKPGSLARILQPLLLSHPLESLDLDQELDAKMCRAVIFDPQGMNETPLKYVAGMILAVPVDAEIYNLPDGALSRVRIAIKTPDQKVALVTPKPTQVYPKEDEPKSYRVLTDAIMSHSVWSEALHVEISVVLDLTSAANLTSRKVGSSGATTGSSGIEQDLIPLCQPVKVYVLPKAVKRGI